MLYKLTYPDGTTRKGEDNETQWGRGVKHTAKGKSCWPRRTMCTDQVIHAYRSPEIAVFANEFHAEIGNPLCWSAKGRVLVEDGLKVGCRTLTTLETVPLPVLTREHGVRIALRTVTEEKLGSSTLPGGWAWLAGRYPENVIMAAALEARDGRGFAGRLTARIKQVIRETGNPYAGTIKPDMVFIDEVKDVPDSLWKKMGGE